MQLLTIIAWTTIILAIIQTIIITIDISRHPQHTMPIMNIVWPLTGLYFPIIGIWAYYRLGREHTSPQQHSPHHHGPHHKTAPHHHIQHTEASHATHHHTSSVHHHGHPQKPFWQSVFVSTTHCSSGCSLGDMIGAPLVFYTGIIIADSMLLTNYIVEFILAYLLGILFQYYGMGFQKHQYPGQAIKDALKADTWSLICFEIGMFGWMALTHLVFFPQMISVASPVFWFMMQIAMMIGFATSYPANWILVKKGIKHAM